MILRSETGLLSAGGIFKDLHRHPRSNVSSKVTSPGALVANSIATNGVKIYYMTAGDSPPGSIALRLVGSRARMLACW